MNSVKGTASFVFASKLKGLKNEVKRWAREEEGRMGRVTDNNLRELAVLDDRSWRGGWGRAIKREGLP